MKTMEFEEEINSLSREKENMKEKPTVIVTGRNFCNILTMSRAIGVAGYNVDVLRVYKSKPSRIHLLRSMKPDAYSKYVNHFYECIVDHQEMKVVNDLKKLGDRNQKKLLIPVDDYLAYIIDKYLLDLNDYFIIPNIDNQAGEITRLMDKNEQKKIASDFHLPMLSSVLIKSKDGEFTIPKEVKYPCFIKPNMSMNSTKAKMMKCDDEETLRKVLTRYAQKEDFEMLVEEYALIKTEYSLLGLSANGVTIAPGIFKVVEGGHKERKGVTLIGETVDIDKFKFIIDECKKFISSLKYTGLFDIDLLETNDGKIYFIELNFRAGASTYMFTKLGVNLPGMYADLLVKEIPVDEECRVKAIGKKFVSEKILMEEFTRSDADFNKVKECMSLVDVYFIKDENDPKPYKYFKKFYLVAALMRIPYRIRDWLRK